MTMIYGLDSVQKEMTSRDETCRQQAAATRNVGSGGNQRRTGVCLIVYHPSPAKEKLRTAPVDSYAYDWINGNEFAPYHRGLNIVVSVIPKNTNRLLKTWKTPLAVSPF